LHYLLTIENEKVSKDFECKLAFTFNVRVDPDNAKGTVLMTIPGLCPVSRWTKKKPFRMKSEGV
jgi:hypothetical protein